MKENIADKLLDVARTSRFIGYDHILDELFNPRRELNARYNQDKYPPYNIERLDENNHAISVAVAGFKREELAVELDNGLLIISGEKMSKSNENLIYQGIAERSFSRSFRLGEYVEVDSVKLEDGILTVMLVKNVPDSMKPRRIEIS